MWANTLTKSLAALALVAVPLLVSAQHETIPEAIVRGAYGRIRTPGSGVGPSVDDILRRTDIVVRGVLGEPRSYLSDDQRDVLTEYPMIEPIFLYQAQFTSASLPGILPTMTVTQLGGTVVLNGVTYTQAEQSLLPLQRGFEGLFLLQRVGNRHMIAGTFVGIFSLSGETLTPLAKTGTLFAAEFKGLSTTEAIADIVNRLRILRP